MLINEHVGYTNTARMFRPVMFVYMDIAFIINMLQIQEK